MNTRHRVGCGREYMPYCENNVRLEESEKPTYCLIDRSAMNSMYKMTKKRLHSKHVLKFKISAAYGISVDVVHII